MTDGDTEAVLIVDAVTETVDTADFALWPVADLPPYQRLPLSGRMSALEVGSAMATLVDYNADTSDGPHSADDAHEHIRRLLETEDVIAPGGLRIRHTGSRVTVSPGCCCGLENWRDWLDMTSGDAPWFGHDPSPRVEHAGPIVRLWPDGGDASEAPAGRPIDIPLDDLPGILHGVRERLLGFLSLTEQWAARHVPSLANDLVAKLDHDLAISGPLP
ncbi:hypothetical protein [Streptomyces sp. NPDC046821]|uniref:hypothetical protein n=1 Tax=Streptomyces sp. NPDC046821 TaxID=3154702 RepID=UPI0033FC7C7E